MPPPTTTNLWRDHRAPLTRWRGHQRGGALRGGHQGPLCQHRARGGRRLRRRPGRDRGRPGPGPRGSGPQRWAGRGRGWGSRRRAAGPNRPLVVLRRLVDPATWRTEAGLTPRRPAWSRCPGAWRPCRRLWATTSAPPPTLRPGRGTGRARACPRAPGPAPRGSGPGATRSSPGRSRTSSLPASRAHASSTPQAAPPTPTSRAQRLDASPGLRHLARRGEVGLAARKGATPPLRAPGHQPALLGRLLGDRISSWASIASCSTVRGSINSPVSSSRPSAIIQA